MRVERRGLKDIADQLGKRQGALLLGAGASASAGIPLADGFVRLIEKQYHAAWERAETKTYTHCMGALDPRARRDLIQQEVKHRKLNLAHVALASLIRADRIDKIVTTNFDSLLTRACALVGVEVAVFDVDALANENFSPLDIDMPAIFYVHGQYYGFTQLNTPRDYGEKHDKFLRALFRDYSQTRPWIVVGYSGENDPSAAPLVQHPEFQHGLYWIGYGDSPPCEQIRESLLIPDKHRYLVSGYDADTSLSTLAKELGCDSMELFQRPFSHLRALFEEVDLSSTDREPQKKNSLSQVFRAMLQYEPPSAATPVWHPEDALRVPDPCLGLLFTLPPFRSLAEGGYTLPEHLVAGVEQPDFRLRAFDTNWGPEIVAIEHHLGRLQHCWIACTPQVPEAHYILMKRVIGAMAPGVECHVVKLSDPNSVLDVQKAIERVYSVEAEDAHLSPRDVISDITGGLSTITAGIVLATLDEERPIEYLTQGVKLIQDGRAMTIEEIRARQLLVALRTSGEMVRGALLRAS